MKGVESLRIQSFKCFRKSWKIPGLDFWESRDRDFENILGSRDTSESRRGLTQDYLCIVYFDDSYHSLQPSTFCGRIYLALIVCPKLFCCRGYRDCVYNEHKVLRDKNNIGEVKPRKSWSLWSLGPILIGKSRLKYIPGKTDVKSSRIFSLSQSFVSCTIPK